MADQVDQVVNAQGLRIAGSGREYTDQAELGDFLLEQIGADAPGTPGTSDPSGKGTDWNAIAAQVQANFTATGFWFL